MSKKVIEDTEVFIYGPCIELRMKGQHESELGTLIQQTNWPQIRDFIDKELGLEPKASRTLSRKEALAYAHDHRA